MDGELQVSFSEDFRPHPTMDGMDEKPNPLAYNHPTVGRVMLETGTFINGIKISEGPMEANPSPPLTTVVCPTIGNMSQPMFPPPPKPREHAGIACPGCGCHIHLTASKAEVQFREAKK